MSYNVSEDRDSHGRWTKGSGGFTRPDQQRNEPAAAAGKPNWRGYGSSEIIRHLAARGLNRQEIEKVTERLGVKPGGSSTLSVQMGKAEIHPTMKEGEKDEIDQHINAVRGGHQSVQSKQTITPSTAPQMRLAPVKHSPTGPVFDAHVARAEASITPHILDRVKSMGAELHTSEFLLDARPDLKGVKPRGWPPGTTWDRANGCATMNRFYVTEKVRQGHVPMDMNSMAESVYRHEIGHVVDHIYKSGIGGEDVSGHTEFRAAYQKDKAALTLMQQIEYSYCLQAGEGGPLECFAEVFASLHGGDIHELEGKPATSKVFPNVAAWMKDYLAIP